MWKLAPASGVRAGRPFAWSPDGRTIALHHVDRRHIRRVPFPSYLGDETIVSELRRGYPGDENERRTAASPRRRHSPAARHHARGAWPPRGQRLSVGARRPAADRSRLGYRHRTLAVGARSRRNHRRGWCGTTSATRASILRTSPAGTPTDVASSCWPTSRSAITSTPSTRPAPRPRRSR